jgi:salicylate hydroxylase
LGLDSAFDVTGITAQAVAPMDAISGKEITRFDLQTQKPPYRFYHRAALIDVLARACAAAGVVIQCNARITQVQTNGQFEVMGLRHSPDLTIGADGLHSVIRPLLNGASEPFFTGQVAWRALVKTEQTDPIARVWMAAGRHLVTYPISNGLLNIVAVQERSNWAAEGWHHDDDPGNLRQAFADCSWRVKSILADVEKVNLWGLFRHPVAEKWHAGSIAILGDAAHPTLPFLAQGANLAIEDAYVLARLCDKNTDPEQGLRSYQAQRRARVVKAIAAANSNARNYHLRGLKKVVAHTGLRAMGKVAPNAFLNRLGWLYDHDVTA